MRILTLRFKNLNSLAGEWKIDFTDPAYVSSGIFAITGPTGSGKTTILDAISLALYGQTPRLKNISKSTNEIMTRNTGECFAEVAFESQHGRFVCHWSQRRAYGRPDGDLQPPKHEISDYTSKEVLENKLTKVMEKVIDSIGLDFDQFTRSIMLAQGDFATFLNANADERAPILEKITGTAIYSDISKKVHERNVDEANKRKEIKDKIGNLDLLSPDEILELKDAYDHAEAEVRKTSSEIESYRIGIAWLQNISRLERDIISLGERRRSAEEKRSQATEDLALLSQARKTLPLEEAYSKLESARELTDIYAREIRENTEKLDASVIPYDESLTEYDSTQNRLNSLKEDLEQEKEVLARVRDLDLRILEIDRQIADKKEDLTKIKDKVLSYRGIISTNMRECGRKKTLRDQAATYLTKHETDGGLSECLSGLGERLIQYSQLVETLDVNKQRLTSQSNDLSRIQKNFFTQNGLLLEKEHKFDETSAELKELQDKYNQLLGDLELKAWRACVVSLKERKSKLEAEVKIHESIEKIGIKIRDLQEKRAVLVEELGRKKENLSGLLHEQHLKEEILEKIEENLELLHRVESLEEERDRLETGKPCPLCGSLDHPYTKGKVPRPDKAKSEWASKRDELKELLEKIHSHEKSVSTLEADLHLNEETEQKWKDQIRELLEDSGLGFYDVGLVTRPSDLQNTIRRALTLCDEYYAWCCDVCESADKMEKSLNDAKDAMNLAKDNLSGQRTSCKDAEVELNICRNTVANLERLVDTNESDKKLLFQELQLDLEGFGIDLAAIGNIDEVLPSLALRKEQFEAELNRKRDLEKEIDLLARDIVNYRTQVHDDQKSADSLGVIIDDKETGKKEVCTQRFTIYGTKDPDTEEKRLAENVKSAEESFQNASDTKKEFSSRIASLKELISSPTQKLQKAQGYWGNWRVHSGKKCGMRDSPPRKTSSPPVSPVSGSKLSKHLRKNLFLKNGIFRPDSRKPPGS